MAGNNSENPIIILAVDDHEMNHRILQAMLNSNRFIVYTADSGEEAIEKLETLLPDLILMDINMNGMNGFETTEKIQQMPRLQQIPILFLSSVSEEKEILRCFQSGGVDYVTKPVRKSELIARIETHVKIKNLRSSLEAEQRRANAIIRNILPEQLISQLKNGRRPEPNRHEDIVILFTDFEDFTSLTQQIGANEMLRHLRVIFYGFDEILHKYNLERIKTVGDGYLAVAGIHSTKEKAALRMLSAVFKMHEFLTLYNQRIGHDIWKLKAGLHKGSVISGIVGFQKIAFDVWGGAVNLASRVETVASSGGAEVTDSFFDDVRIYINSFEEYRKVLSGFGPVNLMKIHSLKTELPQSIRTMGNSIDFSNIFEIMTSDHDFIDKIFGSTQI